MISTVNHALRRATLNEGVEGWAGQAEITVKEVFKTLHTAMDRDELLTLTEIRRPYRMQVCPSCGCANLVRKMNFSQRVLPDPFSAIPTKSMIALERSDSGKIPDLPDIVNKTCAMLLPLGFGMSEAGTVQLFRNHVLLRHNSRLLNRDYRPREGQPIAQDASAPFLVTDTRSPQ